MSNEDDDTQTPGTSGTKPKKKASNDEVEKSQKTDEKKSSILKSGKAANEQKSKKKSVKIESTDPPSQQKGALNDKNSSRYRSRPKRTHQSTTVSNIVPRREAAKRREPTLSTLNYVFEEPSTERDHQLALDFIEKSTQFSARESLLDLRRREKKERIFHHHHRKDRITKRHVHHHKRCRSCLQLQDQCECHDVSKNAGRRSDWAILVNPEPDPPRTWTKPRLDWLEELERNSKFNREQAEEQFSEEQDVCCFPFNTFRIFKKKELRDFDYYCKASELETPEKSVKE